MKNPDLAAFTLATLTLAVLLPLPASAGLKTTLELDAPFGPTLEIGYRVNEHRYFYGTYSELDFDLVTMERAELGWSMATSDNTRHNWGASLGMLMFSGDEDKLWFLDETTVDLPVIATKYAYYFGNNARTTVKLESEFMLIDFQFPMFSLGVGIQIGWW